MRVNRVPQHYRHYFPDAGQHSNERGMQLPASLKKAARADCRQAGYTTPELLIGIGFVGQLIGGAMTGMGAAEKKPKLIPFGLGLGLVSTVVVGLFSDISILGATSLSDRFIYGAATFFFLFGTGLMLGSLKPK